MTTMRDGLEILRAGAHQRMPWKNGGGETFEIAVSPPGATLDSLEWRISMAVVAQDGPFSLFPGIDRTLCILDGAGMELHFSADDVQTLTAESAPLHFAADVAVQAHLLAGTITDLNVMTRRERFVHRVARMALDTQPTPIVVASPTLLLCGHGAVACDVDGGSVQLDARDALLIRDAAGSLRINVAAASAGASLYLIELEALRAD
jgi:environmental stress-induced protein Ves